MQPSGYMLLAGAPHTLNAFMRLNPASQLAILETRKVPIVRDGGSVSVDLLDLLPAEARRAFDEASGSLRSIAAQKALVTKEEQAIADRRSSQSGVTEALRLVFKERGTIEKIAATAEDDGDANKHEWARKWLATGSSLTAEQRETVRCWALTATSKAKSKAAKRHSARS